MCSVFFPGPLVWPSDLVTPPETNTVISIETLQRDTVGVENKKVI